MSYPACQGSFRWSLFVWLTNLLAQLDLEASWSAFLETKGKVGMFSALLRFKLRGYWEINLSMKDFENRVMRSVTWLEGCALYYNRKGRGNDPETFGDHQLSPALMPNRILKPYHAPCSDRWGGNDQSTE